MKEKYKQKQTGIQEMQVEAKSAYNPPLIKKIILFGIPLLGAGILFFIWFEIYKPKIVDDWYRGAILVDSANKITDPTARKILMDEGKAILKQQVSLHPYHARVWFLYGHYFLVNNNWDSCIYAEKMAIKIGAGGVVNNVEYVAADHLNYALGQKLQGIHNLDSSIREIDSAFTPNWENVILYKYKGFTYYNYKQYDSSSVYLERFYGKVKNDFDAILILAYSYTQKGDKDKALYYAMEAKKIKNDNADINNLITRLNTR
jgi:tetratricopeptide (TPR) repeat protein